jgi:hypothetical protein
MEKRNVIYAKCNVLYVYDMVETDDVREKYNKGVRR